MCGRFLSEQTCRPAFQVSVDDDLIRKNPFEFQLVSVIVNDSVTREYKNYSNDKRSQ